MTKILVITTLQVEFDAFLEIFKKRKYKTSPIESQNSISGVSVEKKNFQITVIKSASPGRVQASVSASRFIQSINPNYILLVGIAAAPNGRNFRPGDILVADKIIDISNEKVLDGEENHFKSNSYNVSSKLLIAARSLDIEGWQNKLQTEMSSLSKIPNVYFGPLVSSDKIFTTSKQLYNFIKSNRDLIGVEMEAGGVATAISSFAIQPEFIVIRSVVEVLDTKNDTNKAIVSYFAASFAFKLITEKVISLEPQIASKKAKKDTADSDLTDKFTIGSGAMLNREIDTNLAYLNTAKYANALAEILSESKGEICFAVLGHWGRGKTHLMRLTSKVLRDTYECVWFSAWKYRTKPELWVYLYESFREKLTCVNFFQRIPYIFRGKYIQFGYWPIILLILGLSFVLIPFASVFFYMLGILGIVGLFKFFRLLSFGKSKFTGIKKYIFLNKYSDNLGLQALLGSDLKSLLLGWFGKLKLTKSVIFSSLAAYLASVVGFNFALFWGLDRQNDFALFKNYVGIALYPSSNLLFIISVVVNAFFILVPIWIFFTENPKKRSLLIVDDLDRVTPNEMLDIIESLKLFLEDEKINQVLQVVMIFEEETFKTAVQNKYFELHSNYTDEIKKKNVKEKIYNENMQKLFIAHLKLPPLNDTECLQYAAMCLDFEEPEDRPSKESERLEDIIITKEDAHALTESAEAFDESAEGQAVQNSLTKSEELTNDEKAAIINSIKVFRKNDEAWSSIGPRAIQSLIFKYKLARKLLEARGLEAINPKLLTTLIANRILGIKATSLKTNKESIEAVLNEIC